MCSVATNLVKSIEIEPIRRATMQCLFRRTQNCHVASHFILLSSTANSSGTGGYIVTRECFSQNEEPARTKEERAREKPSFVPSSGFNRCIVNTFVNMKFIHHLYVSCFMFFICIWCIFDKFPLMGNLLISFLCYYLLGRRRNNHFDRLF